MPTNAPTSDAKPLIDEIDKFLAQVGGSIASLKKLKARLARARKQLLAGSGISSPVSLLVKDLRGMPRLPEAPSPSGLLAFLDDRLQGIRREGYRPPKVFTSFRLADSIACRKESAWRAMSGKSLAPASSCSVRACAASASICA